MRELNLLCHILIIIAIAALAESIRILISAVQKPALAKVPPTYLKLDTAIHGDACTDVPGAVDHDLGLFCTDFHAMS